MEKNLSLERLKIKIKKNQHQTKTKKNKKTPQNNIPPQNPNKALFLFEWYLEWTSHASFV